MVSLRHNESIVIYEYLRHRHYTSSGKRNAVNGFGGPHGAKRELASEAEGTLAEEGGRHDRSIRMAGRYYSCIKPNTFAALTWRTVSADPRERRCILQGSSR